MAGAVAHYQAACQYLEATGARLVEFDPAGPFAAGDLLYDGPFVAARTAAVGHHVTAHSDEVDPTVRAIIAAGARCSAVDAFRALHELAAHRAATARLFRRLDTLALPTIPRAVTLAEVAADALGPNTELGRFTSFANLVDLCGLSVPLPDRTGAGGRIDPTAHVSFYGPAWAEATVFRVASALVDATMATRPGGGPRPTRRWHHLGRGRRPPAGPAPGARACGAGAAWLATTHTAPCYRMYALPGGPPHKPALIHRPDGASLEVDLWRVSPAALGRFLTMIPAPLALGSVELDDGSTVTGFVAEPRALDGATDITAHGGWRNYVAQGGELRARSTSRRQSGSIWRPSDG